MIGAVLGSYRIVAKIGGGGMGVVYAAEHATLGRRVAIKVLLPELSRNSDMVARMFSEARAAALMDHPGLVNVHDFGHLPDGSAFIVMELLEGETLAARLNRMRRMPVQDAVAIGRQVASAVGAVHQRGIVHRDLKPDNVFLVQDPEIAGGTRAKVLDFGIAKLTNDGHHSVRTQTGALMGTPAYMSPEQCRGAGAVDARSDIYSLGCILFEMLTGQPPFTYEGMGEVIAAHMFAEAPRTTALVRDVPTWLDVIIARTLAKRPEDRPQSMDDLAVQLGGARVSTRPGVSAAQLQSYPLISVSPTPTALAPPPRRRWRALLTVLAASAALTAGTLALVHVQSSPEPAAARAPAPAPAPDPTPPAPVAPPVTAPPPQPVAVPAPAPAPAPAPPPSTTVKLRIVTTPPGAEVYRAADGIQVGVTPFEQELPSGAGKAVYIVKLEGYQERRAELLTDKDGELELTLARTRSATRSRTAPAHRAHSADDPLDPFGR